jgi:hypothetical protein
MERAKLSAPEELKEIIIIRVKEEWKIGRMEDWAIRVGFIGCSLGGLQPLAAGIQ